jgi:oligoribonuclease NrnB/cAMP/cGMP phosphodiesterase (DHH superfamily)
VSQQHFCIYHANCADGFGAAWVMREWYKREGWVQDHGVDLKFIPAAYQDSPPVLPRGATVKILDFSYKKDALLRMADQVGDEGTIVILDHHKTAQADLANFIDDGKPKDIPIYATFDMNRSGAGMAWDYFFGGKRPAFINHIEDRDLWRFDIPFTKEIQQAIFSHPYDFDTWDTFKYEPVLKVLKTEGEALLRKHFKDINELLPTVTYMRTVEGHNVPFANVPYFFSSDAGNILCEQYDPSLFSVCYWDIPVGRQLSLRSLEGKGLDVSVIARAIGSQAGAISGGGHKHAAGAVITHEHPLARREQSETGRAKLSTDI